MSRIFKHILLLSFGICGQYQYIICIVVDCIPVWLYCHYPYYSSTCSRTDGKQESRRDALQRVQRGLDRVARCLHSGSFTGKFTRIFNVLDYRSEIATSEDVSKLTRFRFELLYHCSKFKLTAISHSVNLIHMNSKDCRRINSGTVAL